MSDKSTKDKSAKMEDKKMSKDTAGKKNPAKKDSSKKKSNPIKAAGKFIREYKSEIKKISWPTVKDTTKNAAVTLAAIAIVGVFIWILDFALSEVRDFSIEKIPKWSASMKADDPVTGSDLVVTDSDAQ
jgi:preprotein translocase, SecE subunit, bacterial